MKAADPESRPTRRCVWASLKQADARDRTGDLALTSEVGPEAFYLEICMFGGVPSLVWEGIPVPTQHFSALFDREVTDRLI